MDKISELLTYRKLICHPEVSGFVFTTNTFVLFYAAELRGIKPIEIKLPVAQGKPQDKQ